MSTRSRRARDASTVDAAAAQQPWPGKRARTERRRRERDDLLLWPGKRARAARLRRPPSDPSRDPLLAPDGGPEPIVEDDPANAPVHAAGDPARGEVATRAPSAADHDDRDA